MRLMRALMSATAVIRISSPTAMPKIFKPMVKRMPTPSGPKALPISPPPDTIEAILSGLPTSFSDKREQVVYEMATCLANARWVAKGLYDRAVEALGHVGITDVITLMGFYASVAMTLAFYDVPAGATGMER